ncbi:hypothetical protein [Huaxiibacter chinensis]|uniref:hypothetical protein n=1 Tax=Huaxiibacter chinensis TaxID=2899785 RepID=UPI003D316942
MSIKRYEWAVCLEHACHCDIIETAEGDMVDYDDYLKEVAALEQQLAESQSKLAQMAAENAGLRLNLQGTAEFCYSELPETPATDAFLAEVRASGVEMCSAEIQKQTWDEREGDGMVAAIDAMEIYAAQLRKERG